MRYLEENMQESSSVTEKTLNNRLMDTYEDSVMFFQMNKRSTLVCFRGSGLKLTNTWYAEREKSEKAERLRIVKTAATIIREDIRTNPYNTTDYLDVTEFMKNADDVVPETLHAFLELVVQKDKKSDKGKLEKKCTAIAHAIIAATRPLCCLYIFYYYLQVASINFSLICICKCVNAADINFLHFCILLSNVSHG